MKRILATSAAVLMAAGTYAGLTATASHATEPDGVETIQVTGSDTVSLHGSLYQAFPVATCPEGYVATGGGDIDGQNLLGHLGPTSDGLGWKGVYNYGTSNPGSITRTVTAICALGTTS